VGVTAHPADDDGTEAAAVAETAREEGMTWATFLDRGSAWAAPIGLEERPHFAVVDRAGRVAHEHHGRLLEGTAEFDGLAAAIDRALSGG
jgi:hypothetical protein